MCGAEAEGSDDECRWSSVTAEANGLAGLGASALALSEWRQGAPPGVPEPVGSPVRKQRDVACG